MDRELFFFFLKKLLIEKVVSLCSFFRDHVERDKVQLSNGVSKHSRCFRTFSNNSSRQRPWRGCELSFPSGAHWGPSALCLGRNTGNSTSSPRPLAFQYKTAGVTGTLEMSSPACWGGGMEGRHASGDQGRGAGRGAGKYFLEGSVVS